MYMTYINKFWKPELVNSYKILINIMNNMFWYGLPMDGEVHILSCRWRLSQNPMCEKKKQKKKHSHCMRIMNTLPVYVTHQMFAFI